MGNESDLYLRCLNCKHYIGAHTTAWEGEICYAFPDGIPKEIIEGDFDHSKPHEGDNGIRFEWKPKGERVLIY